MHHIVSRWLVMGVFVEELADVPMLTAELAAVSTMPSWYARFCHLERNG
ncbi:hypothetical protein AB0758_48510 [Tolypothrix bouteillei VB521301_2]